MSECCETSNTDIVEGTRVHSKHLYDGETRVGCAERYIVKYISPYNVVVEVRRGEDDSFISEFALPREDFEGEYERCPGA